MDILYGLISLLLFGLAWFAMDKTENTGGLLFIASGVFAIAGVLA